MLPVPSSSTEEDILVRVVDMGGQDVYFATHPFFFSRRAVYLLCWCPGIRHRRCPLATT